MSGRGRRIGTPPSDDIDLPKPLPPTDDIERVIRLLEWARIRGYRIGPTLQVGGVIMNVEDLRLDGVEGRSAGPSEPSSAYEAAGLTDEPTPGTVG